MILFFHLRKKAKILSALLILIESLHFIIYILRDGKNQEHRNKDKTISASVSFKILIEPPLQKREEL